MVQDIARALGGAVTTTFLVLCVAAGLLTAYWDGTYSEARGWRREARVARWLGWGVAGAGALLYAFAFAGRILFR